MRDRISRVVRAREARQFDLGRDKPDVRGWPAYANDGALAGVVTSFIIDMRGRAIRYLGLSLHGTGARSSAEVLVPIGWVSRPDDRQVVVVHALSHAQLTAAPRLTHRPITSGDEHTALTAYGTLPSPDVTAQELYQSAMFDECVLFGSTPSHDTQR